MTRKKQKKTQQNKQCPRPRRTLEKRCTYFLTPFGRVIGGCTFTERIEADQNRPGE